MKNSINNAFKIAKKENRPALISYTVCGDNTKDKSLQILNSISKDLDIAEWGIPHNCPTADGKDIQNSSYRALQNGIRLNDIFNLVKRFKKTKPSKPIILMYEAFIGGDLDPNEPHKRQSPAKDSEGYLGKIEEARKRFENLYRS